MSPITEAMKPSRNSDRQSCASSGELLPKNGTAFATESPTTFVSSRPTSFGSSRRAGISDNDFAAQLDRAIERSQGKKLIEAKLSADGQTDAKHYRGFQIADFAVPSPTAR